MLVEKRSGDTDIVRSAIRQQNHLHVTYPRFLHRIERCHHLSLDTEIWPFNRIDPQLVSNEPSCPRRFSHQLWIISIERPYLSVKRQVTTALNAMEKSWIRDIKVILLTNG